MPSFSGAEKYFSLVAERDCGECMVCCKYLYINTPGLKKPADVLCSNCIINRGCSIYETRPNTCRTWHCLWRRTETMPEEMRPDKSNALFSLKISFEPRHIFENAYIVCMTLTDPSVFDTPAVSAAIDRFIQDGELPVWLSYAGSKSLIWPGKEMSEAIISPLSSQARQMPEAEKWLTHYNSLLEPLQDQQAMFGREFLRN